MVRLAEKIKQGWHEIDVTDWLPNSFDARLTRESNQEGNPRGFFKHCLFPKEMVRTQTVAMIARVHDDRIFNQVASFEAGEDSANALIHQRNQAEIALLDTPVFFWSNTKEQLSMQALSIEQSFLLLPFPHQTITQWNILALRKSGRPIEGYLIERIFVI